MVAFNLTMPTVGIIDDRLDHRQTLKRGLDLELSGEWQSVDSEPLASLEEYMSWLSEHDVSVLLLDEKLQEQATVGYDGHDVVSHLRKILPTFPIFVITAYPEDEELKKKFSDVEEIIPRAEFSRHTSEFVPRFLRAAQRYLNSFQAELAELSEKSKKIAEGVATEDDIKTVEAIQAKLELAFTYQFLSDRNEWLQEVEAKLQELEKLRADLGEFLKGQSDH